MELLREGEGEENDGSGKDERCIWLPTGPAKSGIGAPWAPIASLSRWQRRASQSLLLDRRGGGARGAPWGEMASLARWQGRATREVRIRAAEGGARPVWRPTGVVHDGALERMDWGDRPSPHKVDGGRIQLGSETMASEDAATRLPRVARAVVASRRMTGGARVAADRWRHGKQWVLARRRRLLSRWDNVIGQLWARQHVKGRAIAGAASLPPLKLAGQHASLPASAATNRADWRSPPRTSASPEPGDVWGGGHWRQRDDAVSTYRIGGRQQPQPILPTDAAMAGARKHPQGRVMRPHALQAKSVQRPVAGPGEWVGVG